jgi:hypothetical protein
MFPPLCVPQKRGTEAACITAALTINRVGNVGANNNNLDRTTEPILSNLHNFAALILLGIAIFSPFRAYVGDFESSRLPEFWPKVRLDNVGRAVVQSPCRCRMAMQLLAIFSIDH